MIDGPPNAVKPFYPEERTWLEEGLVPPSRGCPLLRMGRCGIDRWIAGENTYASEPPVEPSRNAMVFDVACDLAVVGDAERSGGREAEVEARLDQRSVTR